MCILRFVLSSTVILHIQMCSIPNPDIHMTFRLSGGILRPRRELRVLPGPPAVPRSDPSRLGLRALLHPLRHPIRRDGPPPPRAPLSWRGALFLWHGIPSSRGLTQPGAQHAGLHAQHLQWDVWPQHALHLCVPQWQRVHQPAVTALLRNERRHCLVNRTQILWRQIDTFFRFKCYLFICVFIYLFIYLLASSI